MDPAVLHVTPPPPSLPKRLARVVVPEAFHVSAIAKLERCPLSVLGVPAPDEERHGALLVPHPTAYLGIALHHARGEVLEGRWAGAEGAREALRLAFEQALDALESHLSARSHTAGLVPLRFAVGRRVWMARIRDAERWATGLSVEGGVESPRPLVVGGGRLREPLGYGWCSDDAIGAEKTLHDSELRLRGRPDWSEMVGPKLLLVSEFKSGKVVDRKGALLEDYVVQVQAYALLLERAYPGTRVSAVVDGGARHRVPWGTPERQRLLERVHELHQRLPSGKEIAAAVLAEPGTHCRRCRLRPMCPRYLDDVPTWWPDRGGGPRPLPLDVWGVIEALKVESRGHSITIAAPVSRRVLVDGIAKRHGLGALNVGDWVWLFDLEPSEDLDQHGASVQPRNFHEIPPGPRWATGRRLRVFSINE